MHFRVVRGFTLIEMLVCVLIAGILAALVFGVLPRSIDESRLTGCRQNLRQLYLAAVQYQSDNDDRMPYAMLCPESCDPEIRHATSTLPMVTIRPSPTQFKDALATYGATEGTWWCSGERFKGQAAVGDGEQSYEHSSYREGNVASALRAKFHELGHGWREFEFDLPVKGVFIERCAVMDIRDPLYNCTTSHDIRQPMIEIDGNVRLLVVEKNL